MRKWRNRFTQAHFIALWFGIITLTITGLTPVAASAEDVANEVRSIDVALTGNSLLYTINCAAEPIYTDTERFAPFRLVVDLAGGFFAKDFDKKRSDIPSNPFVTLHLDELSQENPPILRFAFTLADSHSYKVEKHGKALVINISPGAFSRKAPASGSLRTLKDFRVESTPKTTKITIVANEQITDYRVNNIGAGENKPPRMYIDIDKVSVNELVNEKSINRAVKQIRVAKRDDGVRIVFDSGSSQMFKYAVLPTAEGLAVTISEDAASGTNPASAQTSMASATKPQAGAKTSDAILDQLISSSEQLLNQDPQKLVEEQSKAQASIEDDFSFSGYKKKRISVDFYKIDIHNVFRLFRQITDLNIIVDEGVGGSLTLALNDVPWDFALDIILNLMDLKKEERFNTIVIYPAQKAFIWPTRMEDNLEFQADLEVLEEQTIVIENETNLSQEIIEAKQLIASATKAESQENFEKTAEMLTKAFELWPTNVAISNRLATLYLVNLGVNAKALYYARESLKLEPTNTKAALYAAISSANMQRIAEAQEFFNQAISDNPPMKEALLSYAAFSENNNQNEASIALLDKYVEHYGDTMDTMISKARLLDKLGRTEQATAQYKALLASGYPLRPDLRNFIRTRLAPGNNQ